MKKLLFVIPTLKLAGAEKSLVALLNAIDKTEYDIDLFLFAKTGSLLEELPPYINVLPENIKTRAMTLEMRYYFKDLIKAGQFGAAFARLKSTMNNRRGEEKCEWDIIKKYIDPIEGHYDVAISYLETTPNFFVLDKVSADKKIGWIHINYMNGKAATGANEYFRRFDHIATISEKSLETAEIAIPSIKGKISVIENIVSEKEIFSRAEDKTVIDNIDREWKKDRLQLVTIGRLEYQKGIDIGAKAAKVMKDRGVKFEWHIYGQGDMKDKIEQYIIDNDLSDCFILEGLVTNPYPYIKAADIIVQPSRWEGKSIALDEAKILGKPVVVTDYESVHDQIKNGITGVITGMEPDDIADGIIGLSCDKELLKTLSENCIMEGNTSLEAVNKFYKLIGE